MKNLTTFLPWVIPHAPGVSDPLAVRALRDAAIELCEFSQVVQGWLDPITLVEGVTSYDLDGLTDQKVVSVRAATLNGLPLRMLPTVAVTGTPSDEGAPTVAYAEAPDSILVLSLDSPPDAAAAGKTLRVKVAYAPADTATEVDDLLFSNWREAIAAGALSRLCSMPGEAFTNMAISRDQSMQFERAKTRARIEGTRGRIAADISVTPRPFA